MEIIPRQEFIIVECYSIHFMNFHVSCSFHVSVPYFIHNCRSCLSISYVNMQLLMNKERIQYQQRVSMPFSKYDRRWKGGFPMIEKNCCHFYNEILTLHFRQRIP